MLRLVIVVVVALMAIVVLSVCGDGLIDDCVHASIWGADRSDHMRRFISRIAQALGAGMVVSCALLGDVFRRALMALERHSHLSLISSICALRI